MANSRLLSAYNQTLPGTTDELCAYYDEWAKTYGEDFRFGYEGPRVTAETLAGYLSNKKAKILDLASGTGMVGEQLLKCGFSNIHAWDLSRKSLEICAEKQIYKSYMCAKFGTTSGNTQSDVYDALVTCGSFVPGHLNQSSFQDVIRIVKPGGIVVLCMREEYLWRAEEFKNNQLENAIHKMADDGKWTVVLRKRFHNYFHDKDGLAFVFKIV